MIHAHVTQFKRINRAHLEVSAIALVAGPNMAGKSSLCEAVRCALTGDALALRSEERLTKKDHAPKLVRVGAESTGEASRCTLESGEGGAARLTWPKGEYQSKGAHVPAASPIAAGVQSLCEMPQAARAQALVSILHAEPTRERLLKELQTQAFSDPERAAEAVWDVIHRDGWEEALKRVRSKGATLKGQWEEVAGESWGAEKAIGWTPPGWESRFDQVTDEALEQGLTTLHGELQAFDQKHGQRQAALDALVARARRLEGLEGYELPSLQAAAAALADAEREAAAAPPAAVDGEVLACPCCNKPLMLAEKDTRRTLVEAPAGDGAAKDVAAARLRLQNARLNLRQAQDHMADVRRELEAHEAALADARKAGQELRAAQKEAAEGAAAEQRAALVTKVQRGEERAALIRRCRRARDLQRLIVDNGKLAGILHPEGLRLVTLRWALQSFNDVLVVLAGAMRATPIEVTADLRIVNPDGWQYWQMSASQRFRVRILLQLAVAMREGASMVVIDNDVDQDRRWLAGTLRAIAQAGIPAIVTVRADRMEEAPDLERHPLPGVECRTYWVDADGDVRPLEECRADAEAA